MISLENTGARYPVVEENGVGATDPFGNPIPKRAPEVTETERLVHAVGYIDSPEARELDDTDFNLRRDGEIIKKEESYLRLERAVQM